MEIACSNVPAEQAVHTAISILLLFLPPYHHQLPRRLQPFLLDLALSALTSASVILLLNVCTVLHKRAITLDHLEITANEECSYLSWEIFCMDKCGPSTLVTVGILS